MPSTPAPPATSPAAPPDPASPPGSGLEPGASPTVDPAPAVDPAQLAGELRLSITRLARRLRQAADLGLSPSLLSALAIVHRHGPLTLGALAELEGVSPPTVTKVVNRLEDGELVQRALDPNDKRVCRVSTTDTGEALLASSRERKTAWLSERLAALDAEQLAHLTAAAVVLEQLSASEQR
ncbi:MAG: MarR family transcriptional regulator [Actinomycetota bacterium]|nr:MarR family transcriptional regulator [Actinomycetota bacterium]